MRLHRLAGFAALSLALMASSAGALAAPISVNDDPATFSDGLIHLVGVPDAIGAKTSSVHVVAGSTMTAFGDEETLVISLNKEYFTARILDGSARLTSDMASSDIMCAPVNGGSQFPTDAATCIYTTSGSGLATVIDFTAATRFTQTVVDEAVTLPVTFRGGSGGDYFQGAAGNDVIEGNDGPDDLFGGPGADRIDGGASADTVYGEEGEDTLYGGSADDYVSGDEDPDWIYGGTGVDEIDAEDGLKDHRVNCENPAGEGAVQFDYINGVQNPRNYLDVPFNCPVELAPSAPLDLEAFGGADSYTATWSRPEFDGNAPEGDLRYQVAIRILGISLWVYSADLPDTDTSITFGPYKPGLYEIAVRAVNSQGVSSLSNISYISIGNAAGPPRDVVSNFLGNYKGDVTWTAAPTPGSPEAIVAYQVALRVKDKKGKKWQKWTTFPDTTTETSVGLNGSLKLIQGRVYQTRVRTKVLAPSGNSYSDWVYSESRYSGNLNPPTILKVTHSSKSKGMTIDWQFEGRAWQLNGFDVVSPALLKNGTRDVEGTVTYDKASDTFRTEFSSGGTTKYPTCSLTVEYYSGDGPLLPVTTPSFGCVKRN